MKNLKKISAVILALITVMAMTVPAFSISVGTWNPDYSVTTQLDPIRELYVIEFSEYETFGYNINVSETTKDGENTIIPAEEIIASIKKLAQDENLSGNVELTLCINGCEIETQKVNVDFIGKKPIEKLEIKFDKKIAGKTPEDYAEYITFTEGHFSFSKAYNSPIIITTYEGHDARPVFDDEEFVKGKEYDFDVFFDAEEGYYFNSDTVITLNGEEVILSEGDLHTFAGSYDEYFPGTVLLCICFSETIESDGNFLENILSGIKSFFKNIADFFKNLFKRQPV